MGDWWLLAHAGARLVAFRLAVWIVPFRLLRRRALRPPVVSPHTSDHDYPARAGWAVGALGRRIPTMTCLVQALALQSLLRRRGYAGTLVIGVRERRQAALSAHAWVEFDGRVLLGDTGDLGQYRVLAAPDTTAAELAWEP